MAKAITFIALYQIGKHAAGAELELDPEGKEAKRLLNAKAIATREELEKQHPYAKSDDQDDAKVAELEKALEEKGEELEKASDAIQAEAKRADEAEAKVAELEKALEAAKADAAKPANKATK